MLLEEHRNVTELFKFYVSQSSTPENAEYPL